MDSGAANNFTIKFNKRRTECSGKKEDNEKLLKKAEALVSKMDKAEKNAKSDHKDCAGMRSELDKMVSNIT